MSTCISCPCPSCGQSQYVPEANIGKTVACKKCSYRFVVGKPPEPEPEPDEEPSRQRPRQTSLLRTMIWTFFFFYVVFCLVLYFMPGTAAAISGERPNLLQLIDRKAGLVCGLTAGYVIARALTEMLKVKDE